MDDAGSEAMSALCPRIGPASSRGHAACGKLVRRNLAHAAVPSPSRAAPAPRQVAAANLGAAAQPAFSRCSRLPGAAHGPRAAERRVPEVSCGIWRTRRFPRHPSPCPPPLPSPLQVSCTPFCAVTLARYSIKYYFKNIVHASAF